MTPLTTEQKAREDWRKDYLWRHGKDPSMSEEGAFGYGWQAALSSSPVPSKPFKTEAIEALLNGVVPGIVYGPNLQAARAELRVIQAASTPAVSREQELVKELGDLFERLRVRTIEMVHLQEENQRLREALHNISESIDIEQANKIANQALSVSPVATKPKEDV